VPIPTIDAAVSMRQISAQKDARSLIAHKYGCHLPTVETHHHSANGNTVTSQVVTSPKAARKKWEMETTVSEIHKGKMKKHRAEHLKKTVKNASDKQKNDEIRKHFSENFDDFLDDLKNALHSAFIVTYAQGMSLLQTASIEKKYDLNLSEIAKIWRGGCIIRSALLEEMSRAYEESPDLPNLILNFKFAELLNKNREDWRIIVDRFTHSSIPGLCLSTSLAYFDAFRSEILPANLIQSQRDFFGAHTYQRVDKEGIYHTPDWNGENDYLRARSK
jgi:6-phosphogluconate dehydrogenase